MNRLQTGLTHHQTFQLTALWDRIHALYPDPVNRYTDYTTAC